MWQPNHPAIQEGNTETRGGGKSRVILLRSTPQQVDPRNTGLPGLVGFPTPPDPVRVVPSPDADSISAAVTAVRVTSVHRPQLKRTRHKHNREPARRLAASQSDDQRVTTSRLALSHSLPPRSTSPLPRTALDA